mgnify:CR=1 FL=1
MNAGREAFTQADGSIAEGSLVVLSGDCPLITPETIQALIAKREETGAAVVVLTMHMNDPFGYGRIVREGEAVVRIVEQKDATPEEAAITECNSGFYCFDAPALFDALSRVSNDNAQGEYYLTDVLEICRNDGREVLALQTANAEEAMGVNSRVQLAQATRAMQHRINNRHMMAGVTMWDPESTFIGPDVEIAQDVELWPQTYLLGATKVGSHSAIGPNTSLTDTQVAAALALTKRSLSKRASTMLPNVARVRTCVLVPTCAKAPRLARMSKSRSRPLARARRFPIFPISATPRWARTSTSAQVLLPVTMTA